MILRLLLSFFVGLTFVTASYAAIEDQISEFMLDNGMQVVVIEDHRAPVVVHMVWYRAGAADETPGVSGVAHFLEHLLFKKTKNLVAGELSRTVAENGGTDNAFTSYDYTAYYQRVRGGSFIDHDADGGGSDGQLGPDRRRHFGRT